MARSDAVLDRLTRLHPKLIDLSLGRIERLLAGLDHPEAKLAPVVHIAGTNGKGSTLAFLRAMLEAAGKRVIEETIRETLPEGFQRAEYLLDHGMIDMVVHRRDLRETIVRLIDLLRRKTPPAEVVTLPSAEAGSKPAEVPETPGDGAK